jgi:hypothetical protein
MKEQHMNDDKELLEFAAKAAGVKDEMLVFGWWNPLTDDGDALRLAVKLNFRLECMTMQTAASSFDRKTSEPVDHTVQRESVRWPFERCPYAATRRAIVLAAADVGKSRSANPHTV